MLCTLQFVSNITLWFVQVTEENVNTVGQHLYVLRASQIVQPIAIPDAEGFVFAPVKAFIDDKFWRILPSEFLDSAIVSCHKTEALLEAIDTQRTIKTTIVTDYDLQTLRHPVLPLNSSGRKIKDNLSPLFFNILIDCYEDHVQDMFNLSVT